MTIPWHRTPLRAALAVATVALAGCGSGSGDQVPAGAESDVAAEPSHLTQRNGAAGIALDSASS